MNAQTNPLLQFDGLPLFDQIQPQHVAPAMAELLSRARTQVVALSALETPTWDHFIEALDQAIEPLSRAWGQANHLHSVVNTPELRDAYNAALPEITAFYTELSQNESLYAKYKHLAANRESLGLSAIQNKILDNELRDFRLGGAELNAEDKVRFAEIQQALSDLSAQFSQHVLDATDAFALYLQDNGEYELQTDHTALTERVWSELSVAGLPEMVLLMAQELAKADGKTGYKFTLQFPSFLPVQQYAESRSLRELLYTANVTRAAEQGAPDWNNTPIIDQILTLRAEEARLLGFQHYAELSLASKMAASSEEVLRFLRDLAARAKPFAREDRLTLETFAAQELGLASLEPWDLAFASEKLRVQQYSFSEEEVRLYFTEPKVLAGLFKQIHTLFGVDIRPDTAPIWHPDVRFYSLYREDSLIGHFYFDSYARAQKRGGAWMDEVISRCVRAGQLQRPVAQVVCNFSPPTAGQPALLSHDEVLTLFHEFGHALHHLLTEVNERQVSGISGVEWDAVELPSQFLENFGWDYTVLANMTAHLETGEPLPRALFDKMYAAKNFQSGMMMVRQLEFSLFDMMLHSGFEPSDTQTVQHLLDTVRQEVSVNFPPTWNRFQNTFSHIFAGGYAAGYYSYKWAEVLSSDAFARFEEEGLDNPLCGQSFLEEILSKGGSRPAMESFIAFRGRTPDLSALLRHSGMQSEGAN